MLEEQLVDIAFVLEGEVKELCNKEKVEMEAMEEDDYSRTN